MKKTSLPSRSIAILIFVSLVIADYSCSPKATSTAATQLLQHPNVLFISIDDLNDWAQPLVGNKQALTPYLNQFAEQSVNFTKNYCTSPGCNPSRSTLLTGLHTYSSGMYSNYQDWRKIPVLKDMPTLSHYFRQNGYFAAGAGKIFHYDQVDTLGWDEYYPAIKNPMPPDNFPEELPANMPRFKYMYNMFDWSPLAINDEDMGDYKSVQYISEQLQKTHDKPFFLGCGIYRPHVPWYVPQAYFDRFPLEDIELPKVMENDTADLGNRAKEIIRRGGNYHHFVVKAGQWEKAVQGYLASIAFADAMVGRLLDALAKSPYADNTIVVIWSDHGWQLGEKMHWRKFALWENVTRTVLMMKVPQGLASMPQGSAKGAATTNLTSLLDIYPTLVDLCQLPARKDLDGESLVSILEKPDTLIPRPIITTYDFGDYSVRYDKWHYIRYIDDSEELYDLETDPEEWTNLASLTDFVAVKQQLAAFIPTNPIPLPEVSLLPLQEHHIPPIKSREYYFSQERKEWMKRFEVVEN
ncbi:MAG: sulfatase [Saprospiraceae bacterium]